MRQSRMQAAVRDARRVHHGDGGEKENRLMERELGRGKGTRVLIDVKSGGAPGPGPCPKRQAA